MQVHGHAMCIIPVQPKFFAGQYAMQYFTHATQLALSLVTIYLLLDDSILSHFERCHSKNTTNIIDIRLWPLIYCNYNNLLCISNNSECMFLLVPVYIKLAIMIIPLKSAKLLLH